MTKMLPLMLVLAITPGVRYQALVEGHEADPAAFRGKLVPEKAAYGPCVEFARTELADPAAVAAQNWVVTHVRDVAAADPAVELLASDHARSDWLLPAIQGLDAFIDVPPAMLLLPSAVAQEDPDRAVRARNCLALGRSLAERKKDIEIKHARLDLTMAANPVLRARIREKGEVSWPDEESDAAKRELGREAERCFEQVIGQAADFPDLADIARHELHELRQLSVGCRAPEVEGRDVGGKPFKLSDYRDKVVILYFWNQSCGPCLQAFPSLRRYVKQFEGSPVALLGVNCGDKVVDLQPVRDRGEITWRFWCDGDSASGPIAASWNIGMYPTSYVIDAQGIIRYRNVNSGRNLPTAINLFLQELAAKPN